MMATMDMGAQGVTEDEAETIDFIKERIWLDPLAVDLQLSLFIAAMNSYRHDTVLRPFPPMFQSEDKEKDIKTMQSLVEEIPQVSGIPRDCHKLVPGLLELIKWTLDSKPFTMHHLQNSKFEEIQKKTGQTVKCPPPNYIFEVLPSESADEKFQALRQGRDLLYAYHGSRLENFHSILHNGLASHMNKTSIFGEGTYLSGELSVSMIYSPSGQAWNHSEIGNKLSCVAVCEMIDDPSVKCQSKSEEEGNAKGSSSNLSSKGSSSNLRSRANAGPSEGGDVPEKYYVVQNNEMIRVKYLLIYAQKTQTHRSHASKRQSWIHRHKFGLLMFMYFVILCAIGLMNSKTFQSTWKRLWKTR